MNNEISNRMGKEEGIGIEEGKQNNSEEEKTKNGESGVFRVVINEEANEKLELFMKRTEDCKEPISLTKSDLANYVFSHLDKYLTDSDLKNLRALYFDEHGVLKSLLKKYKSEEELPQELKRAIREYYGVAPEREKKRVAR